MTNENKNVFPKSSDITHDQLSEPSEVEVLVGKAKDIISKAHDARQEFLKDALSRDMTDDEIRGAAAAAFSARKLPRIASGESLRSEGYVVWAVSGKEVPEDEFNVVIDKDEKGKPSGIVFQESDTGMLPYQDELADPNDPDEYYVHGLTMPRAWGSKDSASEWRDHIAKLEEALKTF